MTEKARELECPIYLNPGQLASRWGFHPESIRRKIRRGEIPAIAIGGRLLVPVEAVIQIEDDGKIQKN